MKRILVVDDEASIRETIRMILEYEHYTVAFAENGAVALTRLEELSPDLVLMDIKMPGKDGIEVLSEIKRAHPSMPVVMISGHGTFDDAVRATKLGAFDYLPKPLDRDKLLVTVRNALEQRYLTEELSRVRGKDEILGSSKAIREIVDLIARVAPTEARVLITGESGTGKELVARGIHRGSKRAGNPLIEVNCAAIPAELIESELFGHEKGSFTGATAQRMGKFEQADGGTIFLDEIGDMSMQAQAKVLRALEEGKIERVGGNKLIPVDVRVISATNKDLTGEIGRERFREDLYHRLNVIPIHLPPLRDRREDIPVIAKAFIHDVCEKNGLAVKSVSEQTLKLLQGMEWSGNVRELRNAVERLVIMSPGPEIDPTLLGSFRGKHEGALDALLESGGTFQEFKDRAEAAFIRHQLALHNGNVSKTAEALEMERSHLYTKIKKYGLGRERTESPADDEE